MEGQVSPALMVKMMLLVYNLPPFLKAPKLGCVRLKYVKLEEVWLLWCSSEVCVPSSCVMVLPLQSLKMPEVIVSSFSCSLLFFQAGSGQYQPLVGLQVISTFYVANTRYNPILDTRISVRSSVCNAQATPPGF